MLFVQNIGGLAFGIILALFGYVFRYYDNTEASVHLKAAWCVAAAVILAVVSQYSTLENGKFLGSLAFGYVSFRIWGADKMPTKQLAWFWWAYQVLFFGCTGASLLVKSITKEDLRFGFVAIFCGMAARLLTVTLVTSFPRGRFTLRERTFMAMAWVPKATV